MADCRTGNKPLYEPLEQLEHLRTEYHPRCPMITYTIDSCQILSQNKTKSNLQI